MSQVQPWPKIDALLDNSLITAFLDPEASRSSKTAIVELLRQYRYIGIPVVAYAEAFFGIEFSPHMSASLNDFYHYFGDIQIVPITGTTIKPYLEARHSVSLEQGRLYDTWIAASALEHKAIVLTGDDDFDDFAEQGLSVRKVPIT